MKRFFDTSVLVPVFYGDHVHHRASFDLFVESDSGDACCAAHSLAEVYATLTRMPGRHRVGCDQAMLFIGNIRERLTIVALEESDYGEALTAAADIGLVGGTTYDRLLAHCALKADAEVIYTWNIRHYRRFGERIATRLKTP